MESICTVSHLNTVPVTSVLENVHNAFSKNEIIVFSVQYSNFHFWKIHVEVLNSIPC